MGRLLWLGQPKAERTRTFEICADTANARANDSTSVMLRYGTDSLSLLSAARRRYVPSRSRLCLRREFLQRCTLSLRKSTHAETTESADVAVRKKTSIAGVRGACCPIHAASHRLLAIKIDLPVSAHTYKTKIYVKV